MIKKSKDVHKSRKEMNRNSAITKFVVIGVLVMIGIVLCFANFRVPFTDQRFIGFLGAIESKMGIDLRGGVLAVFDTEGNPTDEQIDATARRLESLLHAQGYVEATVVRQGTGIRIEVPGMEDTEEIFRAIGQPSELTMRPQNGGPDSAFLTGQHIRSVAYHQDQRLQHGVLITFTDRGGEIFREQIAGATLNVTRIEIWVGDEMVSNPVVTSHEAGRDNTTVISGNFTAAEARDLRLMIESGLFEARLTPAEVSNIPPQLGPGAVTAGIIAVIVALLFIFLLMWRMYGDLGLLSNLSMLVFMIGFLFSLAVVGAVQLSLPGIVGIILAIAMAVDANIIIFERIKEEYRSGKRMAVAIESGFNKSTTTILDANITTIIAAGVLFFFGTGPIMGFAITLFLGIAISMFCSLVVTRSFAKLYLYINNNNEKRLRLNNSDVKREEPKVRKPQDRKLRGLNT